MALLRCHWPRHRLGRGCRRARLFWGVSWFPFVFGLKCDIEIVIGSSHTPLVTMTHLGKQIITKSMERGHANHDYRMFLSQIWIKCDNGNPFRHSCDTDWHPQYKSMNKSPRQVDHCPLLTSCGGVWDFLQNRERVPEYCVTFHQERNLGETHWWSLSNGPIEEPPKLLRWGYRGFLRTSAILPTIFRSLCFPDSIFQIKMGQGIWGRMKKNIIQMCSLKQIL